MKKKTAVLISGNGSNLQALIDASSREAYPAVLSLVISNKPEAYGLVRAENAGIAVETLSHRDFSTRESYDAALQEILTRYEIELVCLAGFMRLLTPGFTQAWEGRMLNIHPSLLPSFKGLDTQKRALEAGVRFSGCTVHFVVPEMDAGPIIIQAAVPIAPDDTPESLAQRIHAQEHRIYPKALEWLAAGRLSIDKGVVRVQGAGEPSLSLCNPPV